MTGALPPPARTLPADVRPYHRTPDFTETSVPSGLLTSHSTTEGTWGLIRIQSGELLLRFTDERRQHAELRLRAGDATGVIEPTIAHEVEPIGAVRFHVEFFRRPG